MVIKKDYVRLETYKRTYVNFSEQDFEAWWTRLERLLHYLSLMILMTLSSKQARIKAFIGF